MAQLVSPLIEYMTREKMISDVTSEISERVKQVQLTFATSGVYGLQIWKPYYFQPDESLNGNAIKGIQVVTTNTLNPLVDGSVTLASADVFAKLLLWIVSSEGDVITTLPLNQLIADSSVTIATAFPKVQRFCMEDVDWQNSYITIHDTTGISAGESILFNIYFDGE
jgi:hypothetical protein